MKKHLPIRIICLILAASLTLSFTGCDINTNNTAKDTNDIADVEKTEDENNEEASDADLEIAKAEEEERQKAEEEERKKAEEEERQKAEEEERKKAEEEERQKAEEEERKKAEEEERQKAEEEERKRAEEEERKKAEEEKIRAEQMNSYSMMFYLAITAEEIRTSKDNRLILDDIYTSLLNDINPGAIDEITQDHLKNLRDIIKTYITLSIKRERLQYIYNQNKAAAIRSAVPNPLGVLSAATSLDWKRLALSVIYTAVDSYNSYKTASASADKEFLMSGWDLDDEEREAVTKNRDRAFDYMVDMVQEYNLDGMKTLNEAAIETFIEICAIESPYEKIKRLETEEDQYSLLGNYWLELASCYFETEQYSKCLDCVDKYNELYTGIYRQDFNYVKILPQAIVSVQTIYRGNKYNALCEEYADAIIANTSTDDWSTRYFAAQVYMDLYTKTQDREYLRKAYKIATENVTILLKEQRALNDEYINELVDVVAEEPNYAYLSDSEKKEKEKEYKEEQKKAKEYNKARKEERKTELPTLYEPLILNCELMEELAKELKITDSQKKEIDEILQTSSYGIFFVKPINDTYSFNKNATDYHITFNGDKLVIPANLLTSGSNITMVITEADGSKKEITDCKISKVDRQGSTIDTFLATYTSTELKKYKWTANSKISITITYTDVYDKTINFNYKVTEYTTNWYGTTIKFGEA